MKKKKLIIAFLPRFIMNDQNINLFFKIYPKSKLISIIRDPRSWLLSAKKHSNEYENTKFALESWKNSCERSLKLKKKYPKEFILTQFTDLVIDPNKTMRKICQLINISFNESLIKPTFNGDEINSDSAFKSVIGKVDKSVIKTEDKNLSKKDEKILNYYENWFNEMKLSIN